MSPRSGSDDYELHPIAAATKELLGEVFCHWTSGLLGFVPLGYVSAVLHWPPSVVFAINFLAMIPLASVIFAAIGACADHFGPRLGGLVEAFLGKAVEQIMSIQCLRAGLYEVLKGNLMGSMHWCLLLVLGMSIFAAGTVRKMAVFDVKAASAQMTCQIVASSSIVLPTMYRGVAGATHDQVLMLSRVTSFGIMVTYLSFVFFHIRNSHVSDFFGNRARSAGSAEPDSAPLMYQVFLSFLLMICSIWIATGNSQFVVDTIVDMSTTVGVPLPFVGCTLLPIMGNTAEHVHAVSVAKRGNMDQAISIAVGSATQIALFVVPLAVLWGWSLDVPMSLNFTDFDAAVMLLSVFLCSQVMQHGASNWLHGAMLMTTYTMIAIISWFMPEQKG